MYLAYSQLFALQPRDVAPAESSPHVSDAGSQLRQWSSLIGIITAIVGNILISFALNIQRYAHIRIDRESSNGRGRKHSKKQGKKKKDYGAIEQERCADERARINDTAPGPGSPTNNGKQQEEEHSPTSSPDMKASFQSEDTLKAQEKHNGDHSGRKSYLKSPYWWAGIILMTIGEAGNFLAYGFASASIVSPLGVVALISNCMIAPLMLKERFRKRDFWGVLIAIGGAVTVVLSAKQNEKKLDQDALLDYVKRWEFLAYVLVTLVLILGLVYASPKYGERTILIDLGLVGLFGGYTVLATKGVASLLSGSLWNAFTFPITYFLVALLVGSALLQIRYLNRGLQNYDSTQVIPIQFVLFTISVIIGSAVLYRDFESTNADRAVKFIAGCLLTFFGVYLITSGRKREDDSDSEDEGDGDERIRLIDEEANEADNQEETHRKSSHQSTLGEDLAQRLSREQDGAAYQKSPHSSRAPSIIVTPADEGPDQWVTTSDGPEPPSTPKLSKLRTAEDSTPYFTPSSVPQSSKTIRRPSEFLSRTSIPGEPETPTRRKRSLSPTKLANVRPGPSPSPGLIRTARGSIGRLLPGPLMPPLSSSLSAVIADSLLHGEGSPRSERATLRRLRRHRQLQQPRRRSIAAPEDVESQFQLMDDRPYMPRYNTLESEAVMSPGMTPHIGDDEHDPLRLYAQNETEEQEEPSKKPTVSRLRSMSETLSSMIGDWTSLGSTNKKDKRKESKAGIASADDDNSNNRTDSPAPSRPA